MKWGAASVTVPEPRGAPVRPRARPLKDEGELPPCPHRVNSPVPA
jgi:hypothetical protein